MSASDGIVSVHTKAHESEEKQLVHDMKQIVKDIPGVKDLKVQVRLSDIVE